MPKNLEYKELAKAFQQTSTISFSLVLFPIVLLLIGVFLDKKFSTTPLFIIIAIVLGVTLAVYQAIRLGRNIKVKK